MGNKIEILPSHKINHQKWDACVQQNENGLLYATADYLSFLAANWDGLIYNDYECVMPLPWKIKYGIKYCYTPIFIQQLGLIGNINKSEWESVLQAIGRFTKYGDFHFNFSNKEIQKYTAAKPKQNFIIDLSISYSTISEHFKKDTLANIHKSANASLNYHTDFDVNCIDIYFKNYQHKIKELTIDSQSRFKDLCQLLHNKGQCFTRFVTNQQNELLATAVYFIDNTRIYNVMNTTTLKGRKTEANYFLIAQVLREWAGNDLLFDFEGSEIPGVALFYEKFGAQLQPYFHWHHNQLPPLLKWIKR